MFIKVGQKSLGQITPGQILPRQISLRKLTGGGRRCWLFSVKLWLKSRFIFTIYLFGGKKCTYFLKKVLITKSTYLLQFCSRNPEYYVTGRSIRLLIRELFLSRREHYGGTLRFCMLRGGVNRQLMHYPEKSFLQQQVCAGYR